jgi:ornithine--oxo-acid transaminase
MSTKSRSIIALTEKFGAHNYHPLPVVLSRGKGVFVWDVDGKRYFDFLSAYSAVNQGHNHPAIVSAAVKQLQKIALTSRAFYNDKLGPYLKSLCRISRMDRALPMNSGAEAVETAIKAMRLWGYRVKNVPNNQAEIIVCGENFHGRTTTIVGFSSDPDSTDGFGPSTRVWTVPCP